MRHRHRTIQIATLCYVTVDHAAAEYIYRQLAAILRGQIASGKLPAGSRIPPLTALCDAYEVSPMTVRHAIEVLKGEGLVITRPGRGTFVA
jgi:DNA-binding GntR family transcriptional regulator